MRGVNSAGVAGPFSAARSFTAETPPPPAELGSLDVNPTTVVGGNASSGTIVMSSGPATDVAVSLSSSNPAVASVPATTTVPANSFTGGFLVSTAAVAAIDLGGDHGDVQRLEPLGDADGDARRQRPPRACRA